MNSSFTKACIEIQNGGVVAFPTETVYGLGANALNPMAVAKIFQIKERPTFDPLIVHVDSIQGLQDLSIDQNPYIFKLAEHFWPGPLTLVVEKKNLVPDLVTSGLSTVGIRMPDNELALNLIRESGCPIAAPSANKFGCLSPVTAAQVKKQLPQVEYVLDGGPCNVGIESTIVMLNENRCIILRPGKITQQDIEVAFPGVFQFSQNSSEVLVAPGLLKSHYSPNKPLYLLPDNFENFPQKLAENSGIILHKKESFDWDDRKLVYTSLNQNLLEVAANLFTALHTLEDEETVKQIYIASVPLRGIGLAIMDRIHKAAYRYLPSIP